MKLTVKEIRTTLTGIAGEYVSDADDVAVLVDSLLTAQCWGIYSHGLERFPVYMKRLREGLVNASPAIRVEKRLPAVLRIDGDNGLGSVVMQTAMRESMAAADICGVCVAAVRRSNHFSAAGYYVNQLADRGYIALLCTVGPPNMPPYGGMEAYFSTNPIAIGLPCAEKPNLVVDMATSVAAKGKIRAAARRGEPIPEGWAIDKDGNPTTDAQKAIEGLVIPMAGHKGSGLALAVEHLAGVATGSAFGRNVVMQYGDDPRPADVGHMLITIKVGALMEPEEYARRTQKLCDELRRIRPAPGFERVILPGEPEYLRKMAAERDGLEVDDDLWQKILASDVRKA